jgi:hypothetical protein
MQMAGERFWDRGSWVGSRVECVFPRNLHDSTVIILYTVPWYGINQSSLFMFFLPGWFSGGRNPVLWLGHIVVRADATLSARLNGSTIE